MMARSLDIYEFDVAKAPLLYVVDAVRSRALATSLSFSHGSAVRANWNVSDDNEERGIILLRHETRVP